MYDLFYTPAFFVHGLVLVGWLWWLCRRWQIERTESPFFILILLWAGLVLAGHGASFFQGLGSLSLYVPCSFLGVGVMVAVAGRFLKKPAQPPLLAFSPLAFPLPESEKVQKILFRFLWISLALFALVSVILGMSVYPDNADSMIYRLPRAVWYASHGSFTHPFTSPDNRLVYYPLDGVALYIPLVLYGLPGTWHSLPSLIAWAMVGYTTYRFARSFGAARLWALFAAWLVALTPSILAQATSTNDEIISAVAFLSFLYMGLRWLVTGRPVYFLFSGIMVALSAGTKLHIVFLLPMIGIALILLAIRFVKDRALLPRLLKNIGWETGLVTLLFVVVMFAPFLLYNYLSVGRWYFFDEFKQDVFNLSASLQVGFQNLLIYLSQMIFSPIADLNFWPIANDRQAFNTRLNAVFDPLIRPWLSDDPSFYHLGYRFVGITLAVSVRFVEFSLWSAFIWLLWPLQALLALQHRFPLRPFLCLTALTPPLWLLFWSFSTLYMEGTATYFTFYLVCAAPAAVMVFSAIRRSIWSELRWVLISLVALTNLIICHNLVMYSGFRALPDLVYSRTWPYDWLLTEPRIIEEIRDAQRLRIVQTHEKLPFFGYMHWNPRATYYTPFDINGAKPIPNMQEVLQILPISGLNMYGFMPLKIPGKATPGLTYLGAVRAIGREAIFATGNGVEKRYPEESTYIVPQAILQPAENNLWRLSLSGNPLGFSEQDNLTFEYEVKTRGTLLFHREPDKTPALALNLAANPYQVPLTLTLIVRGAWSGKELTRSTYDLSPMGSWLPEGSEY